MIVEKNLHFTLQTARSSYVFRVDETRHLEHLYYGQKISAKDQYYPIYDRHSIPLPAETAFDDDHPSYSLNNLCSEMSSPGKGDYRETSVVIRDTDGSVTHDFRYTDHRIIQGKPRSFTPLPEALPEQESVETLIIVTEDIHSSLTLELYYTTFYTSDVIVRKTALTNNGSAPVSLERIMSAQLDICRKGLDLTTFDGAWGRERRRNRRPVTEGIQINDSKRGISSATHNPLLLISERGADELRGECWAVNLIYSGDHSGIVEMNPYGKVRILSGINPATFRWLLEDRGEVPYSRGDPHVLGLRPQRHQEQLSSLCELPYRPGTVALSSASDRLQYLGIHLLLLRRELSVSYGEGGCQSRDRTVRRG